MILVYIVLILAILVYVWYRYRQHSRNKIERARQRIEQEKNVRLTEMKLRFFTNVSHDLKTPLTLIISPLQTLIRGTSLSASVQKRLQIIEKNAEQLQKHINTLLDFRRLDVGVESLHEQLGDYVAFIKQECDQFMAYSADRNIRFGFKSELDHLYVSFDNEKIHKILYNLLSNAFKYTPDGQYIEVFLFEDMDMVSVDVTDSGPGVPDTDKPYIFDRFYQSHAESALSGSGIGLHIVSEYLRLMGGAVKVKDADGQGSVFTFSIPMKANSPEKIPAAEIDERRAGDENGSYTVLMVDDNRDMCDFVSDALAADYRVLIGNDGREALEILAHENVNVILTDVMMPVMDGLELCRRVKSDLQTSHIPVIMLTSRSGEESVMEGLQTGADDYITKPFNIDKLKLRIEKFISWTLKAHQQFRQMPDVAPGEITITPIDEQFLKSAIALVEKHISDSEYSVETLGQELGMNRTTLWKKIMSLTGKGPSSFIRTIRIKRGKQLLDDGKLQISEIAYSVGFNSVKRFTENFKAEFGVTPSEYKKKDD